ncbi:type VI secretion system contractile sheath large subunit [Enterobacter asburiae]|uniref:type VI secretion system contractile sheath large subunit n=1 Tax=Enterobacter asburiae TaxID=61645 RepID=UPI0021D0A547|nr:type VI secretion system contractile sheath large subunit [Enterobacter asburiae]MCU6244127.1 type VI secretion system contractile sheath large subunit [Enterobacter asburiae]
MTANTLVKSTLPLAHFKSDVSLLDRVINNTRAIRHEVDRDRVREQLDQFLVEVSEGTLVISDDIINSIDERIGIIDNLLSEQISMILHHPDFQKLESTWTGLHTLFNSKETENTQIKVLNASKAELVRDFKLAADFDQSTLFKKIYENEYGTLGGIPYSAMVGDFHFDNTPNDLYLLEQLSHVAAAAHAPFLSSTAPGMFGIDDFSELHKPRDLPALFESTDYLRWKRFRDSEDSCYVGLTLPSVIGRLPYGMKTLPVESFNFEETINVDSRDNYLWVNAAFSLAGQMIKAFEQYGWCTAIRGVEGGGVVDALPTYSYTSVSGDRVMQCPTEVAITERREKELAELGFIPLIYYKGTEKAVFFSINTPNRPRKYDDDQANANARLSVQLQYIMAISRFAHYIKIMMRDKIGSFTTAVSCQNFLQRWLNEYIVSDDNVSFKYKAKYPLRNARVTVTESADEPGNFKAVLYLRPHFQLESLSMSIRLVADLPDGA